MVSYNDTLEKYHIFKSYTVPQPTDTLINILHYYTESEEFSNYPTAIHILPSAGS